jgi:molybdate transport system regulatory protein
MPGLGSTAKTTSCASRNARTGLSICVDTGVGCKIGMKQIALLEAIQAQGSISGAARTLGLSYRGARLLIEGIDKILCRPAVSGLAGGRNGGGTTLTPVGRQLILLYRAIEGRAQVATLAQTEALDGLARTEETNR